MSQFLLILLLDLQVRYTARKLNADRRPRYKGRFIKAADLSAQDLS